jgi:hypothetical protein
MPKITSKPKGNMISPVALDTVLHTFLFAQANAQEASAGVIMRKAILALSAAPDTEYPGHDNEKPFRAPVFLVDDETKTILDALCMNKGRNTVLRNAIWAYHQSLANQSTAQVVILAE